MMGKEFNLTGEFNKAGADLVYIISILIALALGILLGFVIGWGGFN